MPEQSHRLFLYLNIYIYAIANEMLLFIAPYNKPRIEHYSNEDDNAIGWCDDEYNDNKTIYRLIYLM